MRKLDFQQLDPCLSNDVFIRKIFANDDHVFGSVMDESFLPLSNFRALEKLFLNKLKEMIKRVIEPLCEAAVKEDNLKENESKSRLYANANTLVSLVGQSVMNSLSVSQFQDCTNLGKIFNDFYIDKFNVSADYMIRLIEK